MTPSLVALLLLIAAGLVVCSALFSGLETALFALRRHQLRRLESNYPALAGFVQKFRENPRRVLAVILLGSALVNVFLIVICLALLWETPRATRLPPWLIAVSLFAAISCAASNPIIPPSPALCKSFAKIRAEFSRSFSWVPRW